MLPGRATSSCWRVGAFGVRWLGRKRSAVGDRERTLLVGVDSQAQHFIEQWNQYGFAASDLVGVVDPGDAIGPSSFAGRPIVGDHSQLGELLASFRIDTLIFVPGTLSLALDHGQQRWGREKAARVHGARGICRNARRRIRGVGIHAVG